jgi:hypothetical protein
LLSYFINKNAADEIVRNAQNVRTLDALALKEDSVDD